MNTITLQFVIREHTFVLRFPPTSEGETRAYFAVAAWRLQGLVSGHWDCAAMLYAIRDAVDDWQDEQHVTERMG